jgi:hypothetical protein
MTTSPEFEAFLARLYVDADFRQRFLEDRSGEAKRAGLSEAEGAALEGIDRNGLELAARSHKAKRSQKVVRSGWLRRLLNSKLFQS